MEDNINKLSNDELKDIIKDLQNENKKLKTDLHVMKILKDNYELGKKNEDNYREEIFNIIQNDIYIQKIIGPKPTSFDKNTIKFCISELYNTCKALEPFMKYNNIKCRSDLIKKLQTNNIILDNNDIKINNYNKNILKDIDIVSESIKNIVISEKTDLNEKKTCFHIPSKGKNKNIQCNKYVNNETINSNKPLCYIHKKYNKKQ
jgi:hypothetical protein